MIYPFHEQYFTFAEAVDLPQTYAWNIIYDKDLFAELCFPEPYTFEDLGTTYKLQFAANSIYIISQPLYYYIIREGSITLTMNEKHKQDFHEMSSERIKFLPSIPETVLIAKRERIIQALSICMWYNPSDLNSYYPEAEHLLRSKKLKQLMLSKKYTLIWFVF